MTEWHSQLVGEESPLSHANVWKMISGVLFYLRKNKAGTPLSR